jgi:hypothetical protein
MRHSRRRMTCLRSLVRRPGFSMIRAPLRRVSLPTTYRPPKPLGSSRISAESAVVPSPTMGSS